MFSYRHAFHAGNHADVLKHTALIAVLRYLTKKDAPLMVVDTHAGAGLYRLDGDYATTSGEAREGYLRLIEATADHAIAPTPPEALEDYLALVRDFNPPGSYRIYPGSPFIIDRLLRPQDKLKLFELHPTDIKALVANIAQLEAGRRIVTFREDGFEGLKKFLPPPQRRALVLMDPSYELKSDYAQVTSALDDALKRFATGVYMVWHPIIPRPEAHDLPRKLRTLARRSSRGWLHATLQVKSGKPAAPGLGPDAPKPGLPASGIFIINPPHTLGDTLTASLTESARILGQEGQAQFSVDSGH